MFHIQVRYCTSLSSSVLPYLSLFLPSVFFSFTLMYRRSHQSTGNYSPSYQLFPLTWLETDAEVFNRQMVSINFPDMCFPSLSFFFKLWVLFSVWLMLLLPYFFPSATVGLTSLLQLLWLQGPYSESIVMFPFLYSHLLDSV